MLLKLLHLLEELLPLGFGPEDLLSVVSDQWSAYIFER